jgi:hypothetical protein
MVANKSQTVSTRRKGTQRVRARRQRQRHDDRGGKAIDPGQSRRTHGSKHSSRRQLSYHYFIGNRFVELVDLTGSGAANWNGGEEERSMTWIIALLHIDTPHCAESHGIASVLDGIDKPAHPRLAPPCARSGSTNDRIGFLSLSYAASRDSDTTI